MSGNNYVKEYTNVVILRKGISFEQPYAIEFLFNNGFTAFVAADYKETKNTCDKPTFAIEGDVVNVQMYGEINKIISFHNLTLAEKVNKSVHR